MSTGIVIKNMNGYFYIQDEFGTIHECKVRGRIKKSKYSLLVGDRVEFSEDGFVENILPRHNSMIRPAVANIDQVILVVASHNPDINELLLDKMLVMIEHADIPVILCINKYDVGDASTDVLIDKYKSIGYHVITTSAINHIGIDELRNHLQHKITAFAGPSGVGKSSLLNAVDEKFAFQTGEISDKIKRAVVEEDPTEQGVRGHLNYGHTLGHAIEKQMNFSLSHGACVALGMLAAMQIQVARGTLDQGEYDKLKSALKKFSLPTHLGEIDIQAVLENTKNDKKMEAGQVKFILLEEIGKAVIDRTVSLDEMEAALKKIQHEE